MAYSVAILKTKRRDAKSFRKTNISRREGVKQAYENGFKSDDYYYKIKNKIDSCTSELSNGIKGISAIGMKCNAISAGSESQCLSNQYQFSSGLNYLIREMNRCQENVDYYDGKIIIYERQIKEQGGIIHPWE